MQVKFLSSVQLFSLKPGVALLCGLLLMACNAKVIEPMRLKAEPSQAPRRTSSDLTEPKHTNYGVPEASNVNFVNDVQDQVLDLTY